MLVRWNLRQSRGLEATGFFDEAGYTGIISKEASWKGRCSVRYEILMTGVLSMLVNGLLLVSANRLCGATPAVGRCLVVAAVGGMYAVGCVVPGFAFLGSTLWRMVILGVLGMLAFGISIYAVRRTLVFILLAMALGGLASGLEGSGYTKILLAAAVVWILSMAGLQRGVGCSSYASVHLTHRGKTMDVVALRDTGNTLKDPITGESVLILNAEAAKKLVGLDAAMLSDPVSTLSNVQIPGLRLIPYRTVGQGSGMLLALRLDGIRIDGRKTGNLAAFAPAGLDQEGTFQALAGGFV